MYHFLSGYTAKVAGTSRWWNPKRRSQRASGRRSPLPATEYAAMLGERMTTHGVRMWLVNTGWTGGAYGVGQRMKLSHTRAMIAAALGDSWMRSAPTSTPCLASKYLRHALVFRTPCLVCVPRGPTARPTTPWPKTAPIRVQL